MMQSCISSHMSIIRLHCIPAVVSALLWVFREELTAYLAKKYGHHPFSLPSCFKSFYRRRGGVVTRREGGGGEEGGEGGW